jgi:hypothetical protein
VTDHRSGACFTSKAFERVLLAHQIAVQQFDRDFVADVQTLSAKDGSHAALSEAFDQFVFGVENKTYARIGSVLFVSGPWAIGVRYLLEVDLSCSVTRVTSSCHAASAAELRIVG